MPFMNARDYTRLVIADRIAAKRAAPHLTAAKKLLKASQKKLLTLHGLVNLTEYDAAGNVLNGGTLDRLQRGEAITLKAYKCVYQGEHFFLDPDKFEQVGELTFKLKI